MKHRAKLARVDNRGMVVLYLHPAERKYAIPTMKHFTEEKKEIWVEVQEFKPVRSLPQNRLFHVIVQKIANATDNDFDLVKQYLKERFGVYKPIDINKRFKLYRHNQTGQEEVVEGGVMLKKPVEEYTYVKDVVKLQREYVLESTSKYTIDQMMRLIEGALMTGALYGVDLHVERREAENSKKEMKNGTNAPSHA